MDRTTPPELAYQIAVMLDSYSTWLNQYVELDRQRNPDWKMDFYRPTVWLDHDPEQHLYGMIQIDAQFDSGSHHVISITMDDGDEGGTESLTAWWHKLPLWDHTKPHYPRIVGWEYELHHMVQEFDTLLSVVMLEGTLTDTDHKVPEDPTTHPQEGAQ